VGGACIFNLPAPTGHSKVSPKRPLLYCEKFYKAFDHVDHNVLIVKLVALGLPNVIVGRIVAFLQERRQRVKIGRLLSDWLQLGPLTQ